MIVDKSPTFLSIVWIQGVIQNSEPRQWIKQNRAKFEEEAAAKARYLKSKLSFEGRDGQE